jgi:cytochrome c-type biogenesis protein CcmH/NrfF
MIARAARVIAIVAAAALLSSSLAAAADPQTSLSEVSSEVMCPVCGTLLELAESPQAQREKVFIQRLVDAGRGEAQIKAALVAEYGDEVLALPRGSGFSLSAYLVPIIGFAIALLALCFGVVKWRRAGDRSERDAPAGPSREDSERLDADLARYDL